MTGCAVSVDGAGTQSHRETAAGTTSECTPGSDTCGANRTCESDPAGKGKCMPAGSSVAGDPCKYRPAASDCAPGLYCEASGGASGVCRGKDDPSSAGSVPEEGTNGTTDPTGTDPLDPGNNPLGGTDTGSFGSTGTAQCELEDMGACSGKCGSQTGNCGCIPNANYTSSSYSYSTTTSAYCGRVGDGTQDSICTTPRGCAPGFGCTVAPGKTAGRCRKWCIDTSECSIGSRCTLQIKVGDLPHYVCWSSFY